MSDLPSSPRFPSRVRLVGRDEEMATFLSVLRDCFGGHPSSLLITGEPGVGKTRFMTEGCTKAALEFDARVLNGFAVEAGGMPAFFPLARALGSAATELAQTDPAVAKAASVLAAAGIAKASFPGFVALVALSPEAERLRLYDAVTEVCLRLAEARPLLLALDDLQWANAGVWDAIVYLARSTGAAPLCIVAACRDEVFAPGTSGSSALAELNRQRLLFHLPLKPLTAKATRLLGQEFLGGPLTDDLAATLAQRSEGNPFFAEEVLRGLSGALTRDWSGSYYVRAESAARPPLPATLTLAIARRLESLPAETFAVLKAAAILGRNFSSRLVAYMINEDEDAIEKSLVPAVAASVVLGSGGEYAFVHDTIQETVYELATGERHRLHEAAARALERDRVRDFERLSALAHHWYEADSPLAAARASLEAAEVASQVKSYTEALVYARTASQLYERVSDDEHQGEVLKAHLAYAEAALLCGEYGEAEKAFRNTLAHAQSRGDTPLQGRIWGRLGVLFRRRERPDEASACFRSALLLLRGIDRASEEVAEVLIELAGLEGLTRARYGEAREFAGEAAATAESIGDNRLRANAALTMAAIQNRAVDPTAGRSLLLNALELSLAAADPLITAEACASLSNSYYWTGEMQKAYEYGRKRLELAEQAGDVFGMRHAHSWLALVLISFGRWDEARDLLAYSKPLLARLDNPEPLGFVGVLEAVIDFQLGRFEDAYRKASEVVELFEQIDPGTVVWYDGVLILAALAAGRLDDMEKHLLAQEARLHDLSESALPARSARTALGLAYVRLGDREKAADCERALRPYANDHHWWLARRTLAYLAAFTGDTAMAMADLAAAESQARREALLPDLGLVLLKKAELLGPKTLEGRASLQEAQGLLASLGMEAALSEAEATLGAIRSTAPAGLTPREIEVLRLLAQGKTNREIADALIISERTAVNHLSHIFEKIGVDNRTGAAAFALRHGLV